MTKLIWQSENMSAEIYFQIAFWSALRILLLRGTASVSRSLRRVVKGEAGVEVEPLVEVPVLVRAALLRAGLALVVLQLLAHLQEGFNVTREEKKLFCYSSVTRKCCRTEKK